MTVKQNKDMLSSAMGEYQTQIDKLREIMRQKDILITNLKEDKDHSGSVKS
jgi:hypothetical protein